MLYSIQQRIYKFYIYIIAIFNNCVLEMVTDLWPLKYQNIKSYKSYSVTRDNDELLIFFINCNKFLICFSLLTHFIVGIHLARKIVPVDAFKL